MSPQERLHRAAHAVAQLAPHLSCDCPRKRCVRAVAELRRALADVEAELLERLAHAGDCFLEYHGRCGVDCQGQPGWRCDDIDTCASSARYLDAVEEWMESP